MLQLMIVPLHSKNDNLQMTILHTGARIKHKDMEKGGGVEQTIHKTTAQWDRLTKYGKDYLGLK